MVFNVLRLLIVITMPLTLACGAKTNTGRNADSSQWPKDPDADVIDGIGRGGTSPNGRAANCFEQSSREAPESLRTLCDHEIKSNPAFNKLHNVLCVEGKLFSSLNKPTCGWNGTMATINHHIYYYEMEQDTQKDYQDMHASILRVQVPVTKVMIPFRLAFENFEQFKAQGFQWVSGTREHRNLSATTWEQGINYRFRANKELYDIGYQGTTKLYDLGSNTFAHLNFATGDFARILEFAQIVIYKGQADGSTMTIKLEHRKVSSQGLYDRAKKTGLELTRELMEKGFKNATK